MNGASEENDSRYSIENNPAPTTYGRILLADDEEAWCESISSTLTSFGYQCRTASDGLEALAVLNSGEEFDLLIANLMMPNLDGIGLLMRTKEQFPDMPVVIESATHDISVAHAAIRHGAYQYLLKPIEDVKVLIVVRNALRYRRQKLEDQKLGHRFGIECVNCHARKAQIDAWLLKYGPDHFVCCEGPYVVVPPLTCCEDLMRRSLPSGEDR